MNLRLDDDIRSMLPDCHCHVSDYVCLPTKRANGVARRDDRMCH